VLAVKKLYLPIRLTQKNYNMKSYLRFLPALLLLLMGCNGNENTQNNNDLQPDSSTTKSDQPVVREAPVQPQDKPHQGQYCYINKVYTTGDTSYIEADYIQFLMGKEAVAVARKRGDAERIVKNGDTSYSLPNDYYILNENKKVRALKLAKNFEFIAVDLAEEKKAPAASPLNYLKERAKSGIFILTLDQNETVVTIKEQYLP
jgi:hypothetical protein